MNERWIIGLSSGSSIDGVDAALLQVQGTGLQMRLRLEQFVHQPYGRDLRDMIARAGVGQAGGGRTIGLLHRLVGEAFAAAARLVLERTGIGAHKVTCVGMTGHTLWHETEGRYPTNLTLGMADVVAERTGLTVFSDFRNRDLLAGGQGYPLTIIIDQLLFQQPGEPRALIHLGGLATVLFLPAQPGLRHVLGFHAVPCNLLLDGLMRRLTSGRESFDAGGKHAVQGRCIEPLVARWLEHPLLRKKPPKNIPRHEFGEEFLTQATEQVRAMMGNLHDLLCSASHFVARGILEAVKRFLPTAPARVLISGGGARNGLLWHLLEQGLKPVPLEKIDKYGIPAEARKAVAFAGLAALTMDGVPGNVPSATGAQGARLLGSITPGAAPNWERCLQWLQPHTTVRAHAA